MIYHIHNDYDGFDYFVEINDDQLRLLRWLEANGLILDDVWTEQCDIPKVEKI